jgi:hypothetical protein
MLPYTFLCRGFVIESEFDRRLITNNKDQNPPWDDNSRLWVPKVHRRVKKSPCVLAGLWLQVLEYSIDTVT